MKNDARNDKKAKTTKRNAKAAQLLRSLDDASLAAVSGGGCRSCGLAVSLGAQLKAVQ